MTPGSRGSELDDRISQLARVPQLLVACDYDGTVAPIVDDPMKALPRRETVVALRALAGLPQTHVAIISGRSLRDLAALSRLPTEIHLVGSHGSEFDVGFRRGLPPELQARRDDIRAELMSIAARTEGAFVESKPTGLAFHYRMVPDELVADVLDEIRSGPATRPGIFERNANMVIELSVLQTSKADALERIRQQVGASAVLFMGDDVTDEDAFATLAGPDIGVKVGPADTIADFRVDDTVEVAKLLAGLADLRSDWLAGSAAVPIEEHSFLSDQRTAAMVTPDARITWLCVPRVDSAAIFGELVGGSTAGYFAVRPVEGTHPIGQRYLGDTLVLQTSWPRLTVTDYLDCSGGRPERLAGRSDLIRVIEGRGRAVIEFAPRLDFGRSATRLEIRDEGIEVVFGADLMVLRAPGVDWELVDDGFDQTARGVAEVSEDAPVVLELRCGTASLRPDPLDEDARRAENVRFWSGWAERLRDCTVEGPLVRRSALTLKGLCYGPTGAIIAAATTSLPEHIGGIRNWDYRYCWLRDAAMSAAALVRLGSQDEAMEFLDWVLHVLESRDDPERLHPLYNVTGRHLPPEAEITELAGYAGSRPVRVGNAAERQVQLDVFGPIVELVSLLLEQNAPLSGRHWTVVQAMVQAVDRRWSEPDHGIWEIRKPPRHHVYSKVMCWATVDRALQVADHFTGRPQPEWETLRGRIADDVLEHGWKGSVKAFTAAYDGDDLDAASLAIGLEGLVAPDDERFLATIAAIERNLVEGPTVYRYREDDGLPGHEGGFNLMTTWLVDAYHLVGREDDAHVLFKQYAKLAGPTGLLAEEYDPATGRALGNHPQAYSHLGLVNTALRLSGATT